MTRDMASMAKEENQRRHTPRALFSGVARLPRRVSAICGEPAESRRRAGDKSRSGTTHHLTFLGSHRCTAQSPTLTAYPRSVTPAIPLQGLQSVPRLVSIPGAHKTMLSNRRRVVSSGINQGCVRWRNPKMGRCESPCLEGFMASVGRHPWWGRSTSGWPARACPDGHRQQ